MSRDSTIVRAPPQPDNHFRSEALPVVSPARNRLWYTPHAASVHPPAAPPGVVRSAARPEFSKIRPGCPGLDRPGPPPHRHSAETPQNGIQTGLAGGLRV